MLVARAEAHSWPAHCRDARAETLCRIHHNVARTNQLRRRMGQHALPYRWQAEAHPARRARILRYWQRVRHRTQARYHAYHVQPWSSSWYHAAMCVHHYEGAWDANTGNGYYGGLQFDLGTWASAGGTGRPDLQPPSVQLRVAYHLWLSAGWAPWPATSAMCGL